VNDGADLSTEGREGKSIFRIQYLSHGKQTIVPSMMEGVKYSKEWCPIRCPALVSVAQ
jgi:hypothetical protein